MIIACWQPGYLGGAIGALNLGVELVHGHGTIGVNLKFDCFLKRTSRSDAYFTLMMLAFVLLLRALEMSRLVLENAWTYKLDVRSRSVGVPKNEQKRQMKNLVTTQNCI